MDIDLLAELKQRRANGLLTVGGYLVEACNALQVDIATVNRQWLSEQVDMTYTATVNAIARLRARGLI
jgi:hypothetical protein